MTFAAFCKRGHEIALVAGTLPESGEDVGRCVECGARVLRTCPTCEAPMLGLPAAGPGFWGEPPRDPDWRRPDFCHGCGFPYPWVDRSGLIAHLENLLDAEDLDAATELAVREQLDALADPDLDDKTAERRWRRVRELAPGLWEQSGARAVMTTVMSEALKRALGL